MPRSKVPQLGYWLAAPGGAFHMLPHWANNPLELGMLVDRARNDPSILAEQFFLRVEYYEGSPDFFDLGGGNIAMNRRLGLSASLNSLSAGVEYDP